MSRRKNDTKKRNKNGNIKQRFLKPCHYCGANKWQTVEHFVPHWIAINAERLGINLDQKKNEGVACVMCNEEKGGGMDVSHEVSLKFWLDLRARIDEEIERAYGVTSERSE